MSNLEKLGFEVVESSGSDIGYSPQELLVNRYTAFAPGWQSAKFCEYPQILTLKLKSNNYRVLKVQFLMHHYKIPTKITVYTGSDTKTMQKLGFITFGDNSSNSFKFRELKTIHLDTTATYFRFELHKCWINELNLYNQVGIVAINILGVPVDPKFGANLMNVDKAILRGIINRSYANEHTKPTDDLEYFGTDRFIVQCIARVSQLKKEAVEGEDYLKAKELKQLESSLSSAAMEIGNLNSQKQQATRLEDYDRAAELNQRITTIKNNLKASLKKYSLENLEERVVAAVEQKMTLNETVAQPVAPRPASADNRDAGTPEKLNENEAHEYALAISLFGEKAVASTLSPYFGHRQKGLQSIIDAVPTLRGEQKDIVSGTFQIINAVASDSREKSNGYFVELYRVLIEYCVHHEIPSHIVVPSITQTFPGILNKSGDLNPRIRQRAKELVDYLISNYHTEPDSLLPLLIKPFKNIKLQNVPPKHIKTRLDITSECLDSYGVSETHHSGWNVSAIVKFIEPLVGHTSLEVRDSAINLINVLKGFTNDEAIEPLVSLVEQRKKSVTGRASSRAVTPVNNTKSKATNVKAEHSRQPSSNGSGPLEQYQRLNQSVYILRKGRFKVYRGNSG